MFHYLVHEKQHTSLHNNMLDGYFSGTSRQESYSDKVSGGPVDELCFWRTERVNINYDIILPHAPLLPKKSLHWMIPNKNVSSCKYHTAHSTKGCTTSCRLSKAKCTANLVLLGLEFCTAVFTFSFVDTTITTLFKLSPHLNADIS
jgi:hypothetical protein